MKIIKRSIFFAAFLAVISMSTISMAQVSRRQVNYENGTATVIVQYSGDFTTHTARLSGCDIYGDGINSRFGTVNLGITDWYYPGTVHSDFVHGYNKKVGKNAGTAYSQLYNYSDFIVGANANRN